MSATARSAASPEVRFDRRAIADDQTPGATRSATIRREHDAKRCRSERSAVLPDCVPPQATPLCSPASNRYLPGKLTTWILSATIASFGLACRAEQENVVDSGDTIYAGDTVTVIADGVELGLRDKMAATLSAGDKMRVTEVRGSWIGGYVTKDGDRHSGWVRRTEIQLVVISVEDVERIETPDIPDDPDAVAALRALEVTLELNDKNNVHTVDGTESKIGDAGMASLCGLHQLVSLDVSDRTISDNGLRALGESKVLQELYLSNAPITDGGLDHVRQLPNLEVLSLQGTLVVGPGLENLKHLTNLRVLNIGNCDISDDALACLQRLDKLEVLALNGTKISSAGLAHLKPLAKLRVLNINDCDVDDSGLAHLLGLDELRMLYVENTDVTPEGSDELNETLPSLAIFD